MTFNDTLTMLIRAFDLTQAEALDSGEMVYSFGGDQPFGAMAFPNDTLRLHVPLAVEASEELALSRLLEANCLGVETGSARIAQNPDGAGLAMIDFIVLDGLDVDQLQLRIIDLLLYADFWDTQGAEILWQGAPVMPDFSDMTTIRV
ncbi:type III secretion system chaperone [Phaeobacter sp. HF9A]|uniref:type III secretion system chaperone n=1 Tax=Phaeobacter sp. HF9A TaxID=2721561 RepID=UPI00142F70F1|nr:type III secretion system chaperone [Phaeobacter sp. HF9A]NIZ11990.1 type III secretion system chaperone [Phaeobacter sp. HF9A]